MKRSHILLRNITSNFFTKFWLLGLSFLTTPYIFHKFGAARYGLLVLLNTIPVYFTVLDLGITPALVKYIAEFKAKKKNLKNLLGTAFLFYFLLITMWGGVMFFSTNLLIEKVLKIPPQLTATALISLRLIAISFILSSLGTLFNTIPRALQRFEIYNLKHLFLGTIIPLGTILLLTFNKGLVEIIYLHIIANGLIVLIFYFIAKKLLPQTSFAFNFSYPNFKRLLSFGGFKFISSINARIVFQLNQFLIAAFLPIQFVSFYAIPVSLTQKIVSLLPNITTPIFPLVSELHSLTLKEKLIELYKRSTKLVNFLMVPLTLLLFFFAYPLLSIWISKEFANQAALILKILSIAYLLASFPAVPVTVIEGMGKPKITAFFSTLSTILYLVFALLLIPRFGIFGAALAVFLSRIIQTPIFIYYVTGRIIKITNLSFYFNNYLKLIFLGILSAFPFLPFSSFLSSIWHLGGIFTFYGLIYIGLCFITRAIDREDRKIITDFFKQFF